jgi:predicted dehydrogenase
MGAAYADVLRHLNVNYIAIGRSSAKAQRFSAIHNCVVEENGVLAALQRRGAPTSAIIAVPVDDLADVTSTLLKAGTNRILVEKPAGVDSQEIAKLAALTIASSASVFVGYNRRFYASVHYTKNRIAADGGATQLHFEFTELSDAVAKLGYTSAVKQNWFLANSTHVVDLAFYLCGWPLKLHAVTAGSLDWHPTASRFIGMGVTDCGIDFSYFANWDAPGRWGIEIMTAQNRYILRPIEELHIQRRGQFGVERVSIDDQLDHLFKPGLYRQVKSFIEGGDDDRLLSIQLHSEKVDRIYKVMMSGGRIGA